MAALNPVFRAQVQVEDGQISSFTSLESSYNGKQFNLIGLGKIQSVVEYDLQLLEDNTYDIEIDFKKKQITYIPSTQSVGDEQQTIFLGIPTIRIINELRDQYVTAKSLDAIQQPKSDKRSWSTRKLEEFKQGPVDAINNKWLLPPKLCDVAALITFVISVVILFHASPVLNNILSGSQYVFGGMNILNAGIFGKVVLKEIHNASKVDKNITEKLLIGVKGLLVLSMLGAGIATILSVPQIANLMHVSSAVFNLQVFPAFLFFAATLCFTLGILGLVKVSKFKKQLKEKGVDGLVKHYLTVTKEDKVNAEKKLDELKQLSDTDFKTWVEKNIAEDMQSDLLKKSKDLQIEHLRNILIQKELAAKIEEFESLFGEDILHESKQYLINKTDISVLEEKIKNQLKFRTVVAACKVTAPAFMISGFFLSLASMIAGYYLSNITALGLAVPWNYFEKARFIPKASDGKTANVMGPAKEICSDDETIPSDGSEEGERDLLLPPQGLRLDPSTS